MSRRQPTCTSGNNGRVLGQTITAGGLTASQSYSYDALNRLTAAEEITPARTTAFSAACPDGNNTNVWCQQFNYDPAGNQTMGSTLPLK